MRVRNYARPAAIYYQNPLMEFEKRVRPLNDGYKRTIFGLDDIFDTVLTRGSIFRCCPDEATDENSAYGPDSRGR